jgi:uncharacterized protein YjbI with pentapeptide repeats/uncharacterized RDD family membrane protein YckC
MNDSPIKNGNNLSSKHYQSKGHRISKNLLPRRCWAFLLEISILSGTAFIPYSLGAIANSPKSVDKVQLNPILAQTQDTISSIFALEKPSSPDQQVAPLTNLFWWVALITPVGLTGWQVLLLAKTGQTTPKRWLGVRVVTGDGNTPGLQGVILRELIGRWGIPLSAAYLIWRFGGAFPSLPILGGLTGLMLLAESGLIFLGGKKRTFHDLIANTFIIDGKQPLINNNYTYTQSRINFPVNGDYKSLESGEESQLQTIVLTTKIEKGINLWEWMKRHPGATLIIFSSTGMLSVLATFILIQVYIQSQTNFRYSKQQNNQIFLTLVKQLSNTNTQDIETKRAIILAMARLEDPRAGQMLVDLLIEENEPTLIETIQQAIVSNGVESLPALRRLNQSLSNDIKSLANSTSDSEITALRLRATKRAIAKLLTINTGKLNQASLHRTNLGQVSLGNAQFTLILDQVDLSGLNLRSAILSNGSFRHASFYSAGLDNRMATFDDISSDLSGANLQEADLSEAFLPKINLNMANLVRANLNKANLSGANLTGANLSSALIINSNLEKANLQNVSLTGANVSESNLKTVKLQQANLGNLQAVGTNFTGANLLGVSIENANLSAANLTNINLQNSNLTNSNLTEANLANAQLQNAKLNYSNLSKADLRGAKLDGADFQGVIFAQTNNHNFSFIQTSPNTEATAKVEGVNFSQVKNLDNSQLKVICQAGAIHPSCN